MASQLIQRITLQGAEAFVHDILSMSLDGWHPRFDSPQAAGLREQSIGSADPEVHWLWSLLENGELPHVSGRIPDIQLRPC